MKKLKKFKMRSLILVFFLVSTTSANDSTLFKNKKEMSFKTEKMTAFLRHLGGLKKEVCFDVSKVKFECLELEKTKTIDMYQLNFDVDTNKLFLDLTLHFNPGFKQCLLETKRIKKVLGDIGTKCIGLEIVTDETIGNKNKIAGIYSYSTSANYCHTYYIGLCESLNENKRIMK